jgi:hypothetical protein
VSWLDIEVLAVAGDCRHTAEQVADLGGTCDRTAGALVRHGHLHDADFSGLAADAFVRRTTALAARADGLTDRAQAVSRALYSYADGIDAVRALMHRARRAAQPHLATSATQIFSPDSVGASVPLDPARLTAQREAWRQAVDLWREARALEDRTEADLRAALADRPLIPESPPRHRHVPEPRDPGHRDDPPPVVEPPVTAPPPDPHHHVAHHHDGHEEQHAQGELWTPHHHAHGELWTPPHHEGHQPTEPPLVCHTSQFQPTDPHHPIPMPDAGHDQAAPTQEEPHAVR